MVKFFKFNPQGSTVKRAVGEFANQRTGIPHVVRAHLSVLLCLWLWPSAGQEVSPCYFAERVWGVGKGSQ